MDFMVKLKLAVVVLGVFVCLNIASMVSYYNFRQDFEPKCIAWEGVGISYWRDECQYMWRYEVDDTMYNASCSWYLTEKNEEFVGIIIDQNTNLTLDIMNAKCSERLLTERIPYVAR